MNDHPTAPFRYLSNADMRASTPDTHAVIDAVAAGVRAFATGDATAFPTVSIPSSIPGSGIYTIRASIRSLGLASTKTVGSFPANRDRELPPDPGLISLFDLETGLPQLVADASWLTTLRTAAMTALGAKTLANTEVSVIGCIGARGIAPLAAEMISELLGPVAIRLCSRTAQTSAATAARLRRSGIDVTAVDSWDECVDGCDIVIDGAGLNRSEPLLPSALVKPGAVVVSYGAFCSLDDDAMTHFDRVIVDRWDPTPTGALGRLIETGQMTEDRIDAFFGEVLLGNHTARLKDDDKVLFWHRGLGACDITLARAIANQAQFAAVGTTLRRD